MKVHSLFNAGNPRALLIEGPRGGSKTDLPSALARAHNLPLYHTRCSRALLWSLFLLAIVFLTAFSVAAQQEQAQKRRTTHVNISKPPAAQPATGAGNSSEKKAPPANSPTDAEAAKKRADDEAAKKRDDDEAAKKRAGDEAAKKRAADEAEARRAEENERLAAKAALERERERAAAEADAKARVEMEARLADERKAREESERKAKEERDRLEAETKQREEAARRAAEALAAESAAAQAKAEKEAADEARARKEAEARIEDERKAREVAEASSREREARLEKERSETAARLAESERQQKRAADITTLAREMNFRDPAAAVALVPANATDYRAALTEAAHGDVTLVRPVTATTGTFCDGEFVGKALTFDFPGDVATLGNVLNYIRTYTDVNFMPDVEVEDIPVKVNVSNVPWNIVLRNLLDYNDLETTCAGGGVVQIVKRSKMSAIQDNRRKSAPLVEEYIPLRYLQVSPQITVNLAGKANNPGGGGFQSLEDAINKLLQRANDNRAYVTRVPNRNELFVSAPAEVMASIKRLIAKADRESYVVVVRASTYSADESKIKDIGIQSALTLSDAAGLNLGGFSNFPQGATSSTSGQQTGGLNPGGIPGLPTGFARPSGALGAVSPAAVLGGTGLFGTFQFAVQLTALQQKGIINVQQRPALLVNNGDTGVLDFGRTIAVAVQAVGQGNLATGQLELLNAGSTLSVTPQVAEDEKGNPAFVTLDVRLEGNDVDTSVSTPVAPSIVRRAIQTRYVMGNRQTVVFSAFSTDSTTRQQSKTPFLGDLPGIGQLFRRNLSQVSRSRTYFTLSVEIVKQSEIINVATPPSDSSPMPVPPPAPQQPSPFGTSATPKK